MKMCVFCNKELPSDAILCEHCKEYKGVEEDTKIGLTYEELINPSKKHQKKYLGILQKRRDYLIKRINHSQKDLSYDKAEAAALSWAVNKLTKLGEI